MKITIDHEIIKGPGEHEDRISRSYEITYDSESLLVDLIHYKPGEYVNVNAYYHLSKVRSFYLRQVPYLINHRGDVLWDLDMDQVKVEDLVRTHGLKESLKVQTDLCILGGSHKTTDLSVLWEDFREVVERTNKEGDLYPIYQASMVLLEKVFIKKRVSPISLVNFVTSKERWDHFDLARRLEVDPKLAEHLLIVLGYEGDKLTGTYHLYDPDTRPYKDIMSYIEML